MAILDRDVVSLVEALCIILRWLTYRCRYGDVVPKFSTSVSDVSRMFNQIFFFFFHSRLGHFLLENLANAANAIHNKGSEIDICCGVINGIKSKTCCVTDENQRVFCVMSLTCAFTFNLWVSRTTLK